MLTTFIIWIYITIICYLSGIVFLDFSCKLFKIPNNHKVPFFAILLLGITFITTICGYLFLFIQIDLLAHLTIVIPLLFYLTLNFSSIKKDFSILLAKGYEKKIDYIIIALLLLTFLIAITRTTQDIRVRDSGGYHVPLTFWIQSFKIVPGLANLNARFGFYNSWFLPNAFFSLKFLNLQSFHVLDGWIFLVFTFYLIGNIKKLLLGNLEVSNYLSLGLYFLTVWYFSWQLSSLTPDLPVFIVITVSFLFFIKKIEENTLYSFDRYSVCILIYTAAAIPVKLSSIPILVLLPLIFYFEIKQGRYRNLFLGGVIALVLVAYWLYSNVILTGYLIYPPSGKFLDVFNVDWKVHQDFIKVLSVGILNHTRPVRTMGEVFTKLDFWAPIWYQKLDLIERVIYAVMALCPIIYLALSIIKFKAVVKAFDEYKFYILIYFVSLLGVIFWFVATPMLRFGIGFIAINFLLILLPIINKAIKLFENNIAVFISIVLIIFSASFLYLSLKRQLPSLIVQRDYPKVTLNKFLSAGKEFYYPNDTITFEGVKGFWGDCYNSNLRCSYRNERILMRGDSLEDGFKDKNVILDRMRYQP